MHITDIYRTHGQRPATWDAVSSRGVNVRFHFEKELLTVQIVGFPDVNIEHEAKTIGLDDLKTICAPEGITFS